MWMWFAGVVENLDFDVKLKSISFLPSERRWPVMGIRKADTLHEYSAGTNSCFPRHKRRYR